MTLASISTKALVLIKRLQTFLSALTALAGELIASLLQHALIVPALLHSSQLHVF